MSRSRSLVSALLFSLAGRSYAIEAEKAVTAPTARPAPAISPVLPIAALDLRVGAQIQGAAGRPGGPAVVAAAQIPSGALNESLRLRQIPVPALEAVRRPAAAAAAAAATTDAPAASAASAEKPAELDLGGGGQAQLAANLAADGAFASSRDGSSLGAARGQAGLAFDHAGANLGRAQPSAVTAEQVFSAGVARPGGSREEQLTAIADDFARNRALRAQLLAAGADPAARLSALQLAELRGADELARAVAITRVTPAQLRRAARVVDAIPEAAVAALTEKAYQFLRTETPRSTPFAVTSNWDHVERQMLLPLAADQGELARAFARKGQTAEQFADRLRLIMMIHDLGKVEIPADMKAALAKVFPDKDKMWYVNMYILPHEYASFHFIDKLGRETGLNDEQILALQRLVANHNAGPDLVKAENASLRGHWFPDHFRRLTIPALAAMGVPVDKLLARAEDGGLQYNSAEDHHYSALLSAYDRALANSETTFGLSSWYKFANQDHSGWLSELKGVRERNAARPAGSLQQPDPTPIFNGPGVVNAMEQAAQWLETDIRALWKAVYEKHAPPQGWAALGYPRFEPEGEFALWSKKPPSFQDFPPYKKHRVGADKLNIFIHWLKVSNPVGEISRSDIEEEPGVAYYTVYNDCVLGKRETLFRVSMSVVETGDPKAPRVVAKLEQKLESGWGKPTFPEGTVALESPNPVDLLFKLIRADRVVKP